MRASSRSLPIRSRKRACCSPFWCVRRKREDSFEIVAGERRWRAAQLAKLHEVPVIVRTLTDGESLEIAIIENVQRAGLNAIEEALGYQELINKFTYTQDQLSDVIGKSRSHIANMLRLLKLPDSIKEMITDGRLSAGHARTLVGAPNPEQLAKEILSGGLNVRQAEKKAAAPKAPPKKDDKGRRHQGLGIQCFQFTRNEC